MYIYISHTYYEYTYLLVRDLNLRMYVCLDIWVHIENLRFDSPVDMGLSCFYRGQGEGGGGRGRRGREGGKNIPPSLSLSLLFFYGGK